MIFLNVVHVVLCATEFLVSWIIVVVYRCYYLAEDYGRKLPTRDAAIFPFDMTRVSSIFNGNAVSPDLSSLWNNCFLTLSIELQSSLSLGVPLEPPPDLYKWLLDESVELHASSSVSTTNEKSDSDPFVHFQRKIQPFALAAAERELFPIPSHVSSNDPIGDRSDVDGLFFPCFFSFEKNNSHPAS